MRVSASAPILAVVALCGTLATPASAHPSSGIVVDEQGNVFFADIATGLWKIDTDGKLTHVHQEAGHWLALDREGSFSHVDFQKSSHWPRWFKRRTSLGVKPALITDGGSPLVVHRDGNLYYASNGEAMIPGGLQITRLTPDGKLSLVVPDFSKTADRLGGIKGLACGPDGFLYVTYPKAVQKITTDGKVATLADPVEVKDCNQDVRPDSPTPELRGLAIDSHGTVYAAATGCRCVVKIAPDGRVETVLKAERPWSPTGVAVDDGAVYVLEYPDANGDKPEEWSPRVRKLGRDGRFTTLADLAHKSGGRPPR
jgi:sugar lactone lactonase YvrE